jgi:hypothetical protein
MLTFQFIDDSHTVNPRVERFKMIKRGGLLYQKQKGISCVMTRDGCVFAEFDDRPKIGFVLAKGFYLPVCPGNCDISSELVFSAGFLLESASAEFFELPNVFKRIFDEKNKVKYYRKFSTTALGFTAVLHFEHVERLLKKLGHMHFTAMS